MQHLVGEDEFTVVQRVPWESVLDAFPEIRANPFVDRLCEVFSSKKDNCVSFEDMLDLFSALAPSCPVECKAKWAFRIFDFNDSNALETEDLHELIDRLTNGKVIREDGKYLSETEKQHIIDIIMSEVDLDFTGSIVTVEFVHAVSKMPDFCSSFTLKL
ncbi:Hypothetical predicted protein [Cloeon dipterum]|uniref:EF-hand domain-containing protein n=2 Tax=Cloeon dipterum TaxID=197152 RepID=A0A8S1C8E1_9INSE|nr:Hypothetical predicted protein [Cloeon dipterum]